MNPGPVVVPLPDVIRSQAEGAESVIQFSDHEFLIVFLAGQRSRRSVPADNAGGNGRTVIHTTHRGELLERIMNRNPLSAPFLLKLMKGRNVLGKGEAYIELAAEAWSKGPRPRTPSEAAAIWDGVESKTDTARRAGQSADAQALVTVALWNVVEAAHILSCRWLPQPGARIDKLADIDLRLYLSVKDVAGLQTVSDKVNRLDEAIQILKDISPPPSSFTFRWESQERGGPLIVLRHPLTFMIDFFRQQKSRLWPIFSMLKLLRPFWRIPATLFAFDIAAAMLTLPVPFVVASAWRSMGTQDMLIAICVVAGLTLLGMAISAVKGGYEATAISALWLKWQIKFISRTLKQRMRLAAGEMMARFDDAHAAFDGTLDLVMTFLSVLAHIVPAIVILCILPLSFTIQLIVLILFVGVVYAFFSALVYHYSAGMARLRGQTSERMVEVLGKAESIRVMRIVRDAVRRVREKASLFRDEQVKLQVITDLVGVGLRLLTTLDPLILIAQAIVAVRRGELDIGIAIGLGTWISMVVPVFIQLFQAGVDIQRTVVRARRFLEAYHRGSPQDGEPGSAEKGLPFPGRPHILKLNQTAYRLPESGEVLFSIHQKIRLNGITFVSGPSGSGKTTLMMMINRSLSPTAGSVEIDKIDIARFSEPEWARSVVMVPVVDVIVHGTVLENLALGLDTPLDPDAARRLLQKAKLWDTISRRGGVQAMLENEDSLSHGERKRLALARALLANPKILILDEVVDALDPGLEEDIVSLLREHAEIFGTAVIMAAHRPGIVRSEDQIIQLKQNETAVAPIEQAPDSAWAAP